MARKPSDLVGQRFGKLLVIERGTHVKISFKWGYTWKCLCDCGTATETHANNLRSGGTLSCGCHRLALHTKHGLSKTPEYKIWKSMRQRCENPASKSYANYGACGVNVCKRWQTFDLWLSDMGARPTLDHSIERVDNNQGYEPGNCVWATPSQQARNKRKYRNNSSGVTGVHLEADSGLWKAQIGLGGDRINLGRYKSKEAALHSRKRALTDHDFSAKHGE